MSELRKLYLKRVQFLRDNIAPDDIYEFAEQALSCADFFLQKWNEWADINEECDQDKLTHLWVNNLVGLRILEKRGHKDGIKVPEYLPEFE